MDKIETRQYVRIEFDDGQELEVVGLQGLPGEKGKDADEAKIYQKLLAEVVASFSKHVAGILTGPVGPEGPEGPEGQDGKTPSEASLRALISSLLPTSDELRGALALPNREEIMVMIAAAQTAPGIIELFPEAIAEKLNSKPGILTLDAVANLPSILKNLERLRKEGRKQEHGGGLSRVAHDSTLSGDGTSDSPLTVIGGGSSGGAGGFSFENPISAADGITASFTFTHTPVYIVVNQETYYAGKGYTLSGMTATFTDFVPVSGSNITSAYQSISVSTAVRHFGEDAAASGSGTAFTLLFTPITGSVQLYRGGGRISVANGDYTITATAITLTTALRKTDGETLIADYYSSGAGTTGTAIFDERVTGSGTSFTLLFVPIAGSVRLFRGGSRITTANGDYSISGGSITLIAGGALKTGETLTADYEY